MEKQLRALLKSPVCAEEKDQSSDLNLCSDPKICHQMPIWSHQILPWLNDLICYPKAFYNPILIPYDTYWLIFRTNISSHLKLLWRSRLCGVEVSVAFVLRRSSDVYLHDLLHCNYLKGKAAFPALSNEYVVLHHQQPPSVWWEGNYCYFVCCFSKGAI